MLLIDGPPDFDSKHAAISDVRVAHVGKAYSGAQPSADFFKKWELRSRYLAFDGGQVTARLKRPAVIISNHKDGILEVEGWGLKISNDSSPQITREMARRVLSLLSKAESDSLNADEAANWLCILDSCDLEGLMLHRERPQYFEGRLLKNKPDVRVDWHDGHVSIVDQSVAASLDLINPGEDFSCYAKITKMGRVIQIDHVLPLPPIGERIPPEWPTKI